MDPAKGPGPDQKPIGIWIRVSTEDQARGESPLHHEMRAKSYAESRLWRVVEVYHLEGVSGKSVMEHPEAKRMMADVRRKRIAGLIFSKLARLARNTKELLEFSEYFREHGADLVSLQESIDTSTPHGRLFYTMIAAMAEWEREEIASRVAASVPIRARLGKPVAGAAVLGYRWHEKRFEINPDEAPIRRLIYELFKEHKRLKTVAEHLNGAGYRGRKGKPFRDTTVEQLLTDPTAKGLRRANYTKMVKGKRVLKPESEWVWLSCPAIISEELWDECNALLQARKASHKPVAKRAVYVFAGYVYCACGEKMYVRSNTPKYVCMACRTKIPMVDLDRLFQEQLEQFTLSPEAVAAWLAEGSEILSQREELLGALLRERERLTKEADKLYRLYQEDALTVDGFRERHRPLEERLVGLGAEVPRLQEEIDYLKTKTVMRDEILDRTRDLARDWLTMGLGEKRAVVESLVKHITIYKDTVEIVLANLPPLLEMMANGPYSPRGSSATSIRTWPGRWAGSRSGPGRSGGSAMRRSRSAMRRRRKSRG
jgi:site-specific DNA recombinase